MIISENFIIATSAKYEMSPYLFGGAFCRMPFPLPFVILAIARNQAKADSIGELLPTDELDNYLLEDDITELETIELQENEIIVCDKMFDKAGIQPGALLVYDPKRLKYKKEMFMALEVDGIKFAAIVDNHTDSLKYWILTEAFCEDFTLYKKRVNILGAIVGWRKPGEAEYREFDFI